jgi:hypothetical protein
MLDALLRIPSEFGPGAMWFLVFIAAVVAVFVLYVGIALFATLCAHDEPQAKIRYQIFRDLLDLFRHGRGV